MKKNNDKLKDDHAVICGHGILNVYKEGLVVIPRIFDFVSILAKFGDIIHMGDVEEHLPFCRTKADRQSVIKLLKDDDTIFKPGQIVEMWPIHFRTTFNDIVEEGENGYSTGIFIEGTLMNNIISVRNLSESSKMNTLMEGHENRIIRQ